MDAKVAEIARELAALTQRFVDLGATLGEAARALQDAGAPPSNVLVEALSGVPGVDDPLNLRHRSPSYFANPNDARDVSD